MAVSVLLITGMLVGAANVAAQSALLSLPDVSPHARISQRIGLNDPNSWIAHFEASRLAVATGDCDAAVKEAKLAVTVAAEALKAPLGDFVRQLEHKVDINKSHAA